MDRFFQDLRYAVRRLLRSPGFTLIAVLSLALGIGANTAIFSVVNAILLREMPQEDPEELVEIYSTTPELPYGTLSYLDWRDVRERTGDVFEGVATMRLALVQADRGGEVEMLPAELVSGEYFTLQGIGAAMGRTLLPEDDVEPGGHPVVVVSHAYWQRAFGGAADVVGEELLLAGRPYPVVGVVEEEYVGTLRGLVPDVYLPVMMTAQVEPQLSGSSLESRGIQAFFSKGRLRPGVGLPRARSALRRVVADLRSEHPRYWQADRSMTAIPTEDVIVIPQFDRILVPAFGLLLAVVGIVLLIACSNLASFLLARAADRRKEVAVRLAMGARRWTLVRQLLTETMLLAAVGGALGLGLAHLFLVAFGRADLPLPLPIQLDFGLDGNVLVFTAAVSVVAGLSFGLAPALQATNPEVAPTLKDETTGGRPRPFGLRNVLVAGQVALSLTLLVGAGLLIRSVMERQDVDPGFGYEPTAVVTLMAPTDRYGTEEEIGAFFDELKARLAALPGVEAVGLTTNVHLNTLSMSNTRVDVEGVDPPPGRDFHNVDYARVDDGFFDAAGIPILEGRAIRASDGPDAAPVVVVNEAFVERFLSRGSPLGRTVQVFQEDHTVVGVARTARIRSLGEPDRPFIYPSLRQRRSSYADLLVRTSGSAEATVSRVLEVAREMEPFVAVYDARTMERHLATMLLPHRLSAIAATVFAVLALTLASIGLYGVVSYAVASRTREVGIRMSFGADAGRVVRLMMGGALRIVAVGGAVGLVLSYLFARVLSGFLYGVPALDPATFVAVPLVLGFVAVAAALLPALRAARTDPVEALRG